MPQATENRIVVDEHNVASFLGAEASRYSYNPELRRLVTMCFQASERSTNHFFVLEGNVIRAAQSTLEGAREYMADGRILVLCA